jgi:hypothetical protein
MAIARAAAHRRSVRALILYGTSPRRPPGSVMRQLRVMARHWGQGDSLMMFASTLAGELARHDRAVSNGRRRGRAWSGDQGSPARAA